MHAQATEVSANAGHAREFCKVTKRRVLTDPLPSESSLSKSALPSVISTAIPSFRKLECHSSASINPLRRGVQAPKDKRRQGYRSRPEEAHAGRPGLLGTGPPKALGRPRHWAARGTGPPKALGRPRHWAAQGTGPREGRAAERRRLLVVGVPLSDDIADARVALAQLAPQPGLEGGEAGGLGGVVGMAHLREQLLSLKQPLRLLRIDKSTEHQHRERRVSSKSQRRARAAQSTGHGRYGTAARTCAAFSKAAATARDMTPLVSTWCFFLVSTSWTSLTSFRREAFTWRTQAGGGTGAPHGRHSEEGCQ